MTLGKHGGIVGALLVGAVLITGCGDSGESDAERELARIRDQQVQDAQRRADDAERQLRESQEQPRTVEKEDDEDLDDSKSSGGDTPRPAPRREPAPETDTPAESGLVGLGDPACLGGRIRVSSNTTCEFAAIVRQDYLNNVSKGRLTFNSFSPAVGKNIRMSCSMTAPHTCTGGNNAVVYFN